MSPTVRIDAQPDPIVRGKPAMYTAIASDPDGDAVTFQWARTEPECPPDFQEASVWPVDGWKPGNNGDNELDLQPADTMTTFCVWVKASDRYGATAVDGRTGDPHDQAPVAVLDLVSPTDAQSDPPNTSSFPVHTMFTLSAGASTDPDDQANSLTFKWTSTPDVGLAACPGPANDAARCFKADATGDFQITVLVSDAHGQSSSATRPLHIVAGKLPVARIDLVTPSGPGPYALGSLFQVSGARSTGDGTPPTPDWSAFRPPTGSKAKLDFCAGSSDPAVRCFTADVDGAYEVGLTVTDEAGTSAPISLPLVVAPDQPPCLAATNPTLDEPVTTMTSFSVDSVVDDLDPYPSDKSMQWFLSEEGGPFVPAELGFPSFSMNPAAFSFGEVVRVRVEIHDRDTTRSQRAFIDCGDAPTCSSPSVIYPKTCFQRFTWTVNILP